MQAPVVLVDMDGVLANFVAGTFRHLREKRPNIEMPALSLFRVHHNFEDEAVRADIVSIINTEGFFRNLPLIDGALDGWQRIIDLGYQPQICSSPLRSNQWCEVEKRQWLAEHFGDDVARDALITRDKYQHDGIALIDDRTDLHHVDQAPWQQILFDASYNQDFETDYRLLSWHDPNLGDLLKRAS